MVFPASGHFSIKYLLVSCSVASIFFLAGSFCEFAADKIKNETKRIKAFFINFI
jgi:hypothetical protein